MGAAEIQQWLEEHGGQAKDPITDANGVTVYVGADGSYIAVRRDGSIAMRGFAPPSGGSTSQSAAQAPTAPAPDTTDATQPDATAQAGASPLATYTQDQVGQRLAEIAQQIGAQPRYLPQQRTRRVPNPAANPTDPRFKPGSDAYVDQPYTIESWYDPRNNTLLFQGQRQPDGTFQTTTDAAPRPPASATQPAEPPLTQDRGGRHYVWKPNPGGSAAGGQWVDVGPAPLTPAEQAQRPKSSRTPVPNRPGLYEVTTVNPQTNQTETHYENDQGQTVPTPTAPKQATIVKGAGPNGEDVQAITDPVTGQITGYQPIPGAQAPPDKTGFAQGAPRFAPNFNASSYDLGLMDYHTALTDWVASQGNTLQARQTASSLMQQAGEIASAAGARENTVYGRQQAARGQDITQRQQDLSEVQSRRQDVGTGYDTLFRDFSGSARYLGHGGGDIAGQAFMDSLNLRDARIAAAGGYAQVPRIDPVDLGALRSTQVSVSPEGNVHVSPPGAMPAVTSGITATSRAAMNPSGPNVQAATDATMAGSNAAFGALGVGPGAQPPAYLGPIGPANLFPTPQAQAWDPGGTVASLQQQGYSPEEIQAALDDHHASWSPLA